MPGNETLLLPHEKHLLELQVDHLTTQFRLASEAQGEAAGAGGDWHDNAPYDDARQRTALTDRMRVEAASVLHEGKLVDYPDPDSKVIQLGSLVLGRDRFGYMPFVVVGQRIAGLDLYANMWETGEHPYTDLGEDMEDLAVVTPLSPLGAVALNAAVGAELHYQNNARSMMVQVEGINQEWIRRFQS